MKRQVILAFIEHFEKELSQLIRSAKTAHEAATHEESRAEDRHDTFAIEASYLAAGQAVRVQDIRKSIAELKGFLENASTTPIRSIEEAALVVLESLGKRTYSFIATTGGGTQVSVEGKTVSIVTPLSPLGENLIGLSEGDMFTLESKNGSREHVVLEIH